MLSETIFYVLRTADIVSSVGTPENVHPDSIHRKNATLTCPMSIGPLYQLS